MNWDRIEDDWKGIRGEVIEQWDHRAGGQRASRVRDPCGISDDGDGHERTEWEQRLREIERSAQ